jgi:hypothetical protein
MYLLFGFSIQQFSSQYSTPLVDMRFCRHVPNSLKNKNMEMYIPHLFKKMVSRPSKLGCPTWAHGKNLFVNFERYDLANSKK